MRVPLVRDQRRDGGTESREGARADQRLERGVRRLAREADDATLAELSVHLDPSPVEDRPLLPCSGEEVLAVATRVTGPRRPSGRNESCVVVLRIELGCLGAVAKPSPRRPPGGCTSGPEEPAHGTERVTE